MNSHYAVRGYWKTGPVFGFGMLFGIALTLAVFLLWLPGARQDPGERPLRPGSQTERKAPVKRPGERPNLVAAVLEARA